MSPLPPSTMVERLERLERQERRRKRMRIPVLVGLVALAAGGAKLGDPPKIVEAERVVLRDKAGKTRAQLAVGQDGSPNLEFYDEGGKPRIEIAIGPLGPQLTLSGENQEHRIFMTANKLGASEFSMYGPDGGFLNLITEGKPNSMMEIVMGQKERGERLRIFDQPLGPAITFLDKGGDVRLSLGSDADGSADLSVLDKAGKNRLTLGGKMDGTPFLEIQDKEGKKLFSTPK